MKKALELRKNIQAIDHRGYPAYKELRGIYDFGAYSLSIDHVQGDPFASPSHLSVHVPAENAAFPQEYIEEAAKRITCEDHLTRLFHKALAPCSFQAKGSGKSGLLEVSRCGQQVLERTACHIDSKGNVILRFEAGFPANGRSINAASLIKMLFDLLPDVIHNSLLYANIDKESLRKAIWLCEDQQYIRKQLPVLGLCAFLADDSILPRQSGVSDRPMQNAIPFNSPESMRISLELPHRGIVYGMGIKKGITLFAGGGYHGKSTLLQALEMGVYNHIANDGRELVITDATAWKLRAEDGRSIAQVDISPFINYLPNKKDTRHFSTEDASGSTSQAANLMEAIESGSRLLLIDEDTSATNFMIRDELMQKVICREEEPITPFIERVQSMYNDLAVSSVIVAGSSGSFFQIADTIIQMKEYIPYDITDKAKEAAKEYPALSVSESFPTCGTKRSPKPNMALKKAERIKLKSMGVHEILIEKDAVELRYLEQLIDSEQAKTLAYALKYIQKHFLDGKKSMADILDALEQLMETQGLCALFDKEYIRSGLARPRRQELAACFNRYRKLYF